MKTGIFVSIICGCAILVATLFGAVIELRESLKKAESNNVALVQQFDSLKVRPLQMSANDFKELLPELADSIEALTGSGKIDFI